jgi:alanine racemase
MLRIRHDEARAALPLRVSADIDLGAVRDNLGLLRSRLRTGCRVIAVVKADGYGHGAVQVARTALAAGAAELAVADAGEGVRLREAGVEAPILVVGPSQPEDAAAIVHHRLRPTVADAEFARALAAHAQRTVPIEIELDTGMRRHGILDEDAVAFVRSLRVHKHLQVRAVFTHFAGLDRTAIEDMRAQWRRFEAAREALAFVGYDVEAHACNTLATVLLPEAHAAAVRIGGGLYGFDCGTRLSGLRPAMTLKTRVVGVRGAAPGDFVGYGAMHRVTRATTLLLLPCGYADGLSRAHWNGKDVLVRGHRRPIVGQVSMNQTVVDGGDLDFEIGDEVVLLGAQGRERIRAEDRAASGCSAYEVTTLLRSDLARRYVGAEPAVSRLS